MITQPEKSKLCGQCCLAEILGISLEESIKLIGHEKATYYKELIKHFNHGKIKKGMPKDYSLYRMVLCRIVPKTKSTWRGHWIIYYVHHSPEFDLAYDPTIGILVGFDYMLKELNARVISHIEIILND